MAGRFKITVSEISAILSSLLPGHSLSQDLISQKSWSFYGYGCRDVIMAVMVGIRPLSIRRRLPGIISEIPLVSPDILGVAAGCTFGAALGIILPGDSFYLVQSLAFGFGLMAVFMAVGIARLISVKARHCNGFGGHGGIALFFQCPADAAEIFFRSL